MHSESAIYDVLKNIIDPDLQQDIVRLGFVQNLKIEASRVQFDLVLTTPACPVKDQFVIQAQELLRKHLGIHDVEVTISSQKITQSKMKQSQSDALKDVRTIIAVSSCKGGVGKSSVAAQMALALAKRGFRVGLLDLDIHGPSVPTLLNCQRAQVQQKEQQLYPVDVSGLKVMSFGFLLGEAPAVMRGPIVSRYVQSLLFQTAWGILDYLFLDLPPGTSDVQLTLTQMVALDGAVIVTTPHSLSLQDVSRGILMFEKVKVPVLGVIENMSYLECTGCQSRQFIFGESRAATLSSRFGIPVLEQLPMDIRLQNPLLSFDLPVVQSLVDQTIRAIGRQSAAQDHSPTIAQGKRQLTLTWGEKNDVVVDYYELRTKCPCALCVDEMTGETRLKKELIPEEVHPKTITTLGNYAIGIEWSDGHTSGIYPYELLRSLQKQKV